MPLILICLKELFKDLDASIWYTTKFQRIFLSLPMTISDSQKGKCQIELAYKVSDILPFQVKTDVQGKFSVKGMLCVGRQC